MKRFMRWIRHSLKTSATAGGEEPAAPLVTAVNVSTRSVIARRVQWAGTSEARRRGLLGRENIEPDEGVYIVPTQWIHMFGMRFPIDLAFLGAGGRVLHVHRGIKPNRLSRAVWRAEGALEVAEGALLASDTKVGDIVEFTRESESYARTPTSPATPNGSQ